MINFRLARDARLRDDERARDFQHMGRWKSQATRLEYKSFGGLARALERNIDDTAIAVRQAAQELTVRGASLDQVYTTYARATGAAVNTATVDGDSVLIQSAVECAVGSVRSALHSPSASPATSALEAHVLEAAFAFESLGDASSDVILRLADGPRGQKAANQWRRDAEAERDSGERSLVFSTAFINAAAKRARDEDALTKSLAPTPGPTRRATPPKARAKKRKTESEGDRRGAGDRRNDADRTRTGRGPRGSDSESRAHEGGGGSERFFKSPY